jgi:OTU domain-containing protein 5
LLELELESLVVQAKNSDYFSQYVTEDFDKYIQRKRSDHIHGNHIEMQAMSELFNRPIEVFHYSSEPINIFQGCHQADKIKENYPIRLSYHRNVHYNSIVDPFKATIGVGLGLPAFKPGLAEKNLMDNAIHISEQTEIEQAMLEDKLKATDWEATNEAIEEQVARESYIEWVRENETRSNDMKSKQAKQASPCSSASATSSNNTNNELSCKSPTNNSKGSSPRSSPKASSSGTNRFHSKVSKESVKESQPITNAESAQSEFSLVETASFMHQFPPSVFGEFCLHLSVLTF